VNSSVSIIVDALIVLILFVGLAQFRNPKGARKGNAMAAIAMMCGILVVFFHDGLAYPALVLPLLIIGAVVGWAVAAKVTMIHIPGMVAFQNGAGGAAALLVSFIELWRGGGGEGLMVISKVSGLLGVIVGAGTFSGSMVASAKLMGMMNPKPSVLKFHDSIMAFLTIAIVILSFFVGSSNPVAVIAVPAALAVLGCALGIIFSIRIGGADMPVLISFLNTTSGVAAAFCGIIVSNRLLISAGAIVAASGSILTYMMCKAMNRSMLKVFWGGSLSDGMAAATEPVLNEISGAASGDPLERAVEALGSAKSVVIVPGYGMAIGQAQFRVNELAQLLEKAGKEVRFAIHPVAGRMPGHMNVLLAEADVPYDKLFEMDAINPSFPETDVAMVVGACDVVNPSAIDKPGTPITGMPILKVYEAKSVIVCNLDEKPGYSGVPNSLYEQPHAILLFGNALETVGSIIDGMSANPA